MFVVLAKLVVVSHFGFVAFVFLGGLLFSKLPRLIYAHAACLLYAMVITVVGWPCPLTILEQWLLSAGGAPVYSGEFLPYYVWSHVGLRGDEVALGTAMVVALVAANIFPYRSWLGRSSTAVASFKRRS